MWTKGQSGNKNGRPKDAVATALRESIGSSVDIAKLRYSLDILPEGSEYVQGIAKLLPFILPRLQSIEVVNVGDITEHLPTLTDYELGKLMQEIVKEYETRPISSKATDSEQQYTNEHEQGLY
jgi:hypothetical protein